MALAGHGIVINIDSSTPGTADVEIDGLKSASYAPTNDLLDVTDFADGNARERIQGLEDGTITLSGDYETSAGQAYLRSQHAAGGDVTIQILWNGSAGHEVACKVADYEISADVDGLVEFSCNLQFNEIPSAV